MSKLYENYIEVAIRMAKIEAIRTRTEGMKAENKLYELKGKIPPYTQADFEHQADAISKLAEEMVNFKLSGSDN